MALSLAACSADPEVAGEGPGAGKADDPTEIVEGCTSYAEAIVTGRLLDSGADEISGLVMSRQNPGLLWAHDDGDRGKIYGFDRHGQMRHELELHGLSLVDLEDIAIGPGPDLDRDYLYLADTGDNAHSRAEVSVIRFPEPRLGVGADDVPAEVEVFRFRYDDGNAHNAEALLVSPDTGVLYVITKTGSLEDRTRVYQSAPPAELDPSEPNELREVLRADDAPELAGSVVAADMSADGRRLALLFRDAPTRTWLLQPGESIVDAMQRPACLAPHAPGQQEALAYSTASDGYYIVPEGVEPRVYFVAPRARCSDFDEAEDRGHVVTASLPEVSGLALSPRDPELLWAVNDASTGASRNFLSALRTDGSHLADIALPGLVNEDWEDLAIGPGPVLGASYIYIADIGDKELERASITVHRLLEPEPDGEVQLIETFRFEYPGDTPHDAESLVIDPISGDLLIVTRQRPGDARTRVYRALAPFDASSTARLHKVLDDGDNPDLEDIVAADISSDGLMLALARRDKSPLLFPRSAEGPAFEALQYRGCRAREAPGQHDSIALDIGGSGYYQVSNSQTPHLFYSKATLDD